MISVTEPTNNTRYVYFDDGGVIMSITGRELESNSGNFAYFNIEDISNFLNGTYKFSDYTVVRTSNPLVFEIIKKKVNIRTRNAENQIHKIVKSDETGIIVEITETSIQIYASDTLINSTNVKENQKVSVAGTTHHPFFITHKDKPNFIIDTVFVDFGKLLSGVKTIINYEHKYDISVYTKKYFDTYSLRRA